MGGQGLVRTEGGGLSERGLLMVVLVVVDVEVPPMASWQEPDSSLLAQRRPLIGCHTSSSGSLTLQPNHTNHLFN